MDIGSNFGQFSRFALSINPGARLWRVDPWPGMKADARYAIGNGSIKTLVKSSGSVMTARAQDRGSGIQVGCKTLDEVRADMPSDMQEIFLIKIDVDGGEREVIDSGPECLEHARWLVCEVCGQKDLDYLIQRLGVPETVNGFDFVWRLNKA